MCTADAMEATLASWSEEDVAGSGGDVGSGSGGGGDGGAGLAAPCATRETACVFNVVTDVNETHNLFAEPAYQDVVKLLLSRVDYHAGRMFNYSIDHTNVTAAE